MSEQADQHRTPEQRKHLVTSEELDRTASTTTEKTDLTRHRGEGNGVRVHVVYFGLISLLVLAFLIGAIALATRMM